MDVLLDLFYNVLAVIVVVLFLRWCAMRPSKITFPPMSRCHVCGKGEHAEGEGYHYRS